MGGLVITEPAPLRMKVPLIGALFTKLTPPVVETLPKAPVPVINAVVALLPVKLTTPAVPVKVPIFASVDDPPMLRLPPAAISMVPLLVSVLFTVSTPEVVKLSD